MAILRTDLPDSGGLDVWCAEDADCPVHFHELRNAKALDMKRLDDILAARATGKADAAKRQAVDSALQAEFEKRKAAAGDVYAKSGVDAVASVFSTAVGAPK
jgi:hypothetical protein